LHRNVGTAPLSGNKIEGDVPKSIGPPYKREKEAFDMADETPLLDTLAAMTAASLENSNLEARELLLCRIAALAAVDAPAVSYLLHIGPAMDVGVTAEDARDVLTAVAPIIGAPKTIVAADNITRALGFAIVAVEEALLEELEEEELEEAEEEEEEE
jgi:alkylhydroperoxidase/carboxymuconolactone decarboxylase family protein YurZ